MTEEIRTEAIWPLADYAIWVPLTDDFYKSLGVGKLSLEAYQSGNYTPHKTYVDSRAYLRPIIKHFKEHASTPRIFDVGGYIGRFSIESALACTEINIDCNITCFEPGNTFDLIVRNLELNGMQSLVDLQPIAASDKAQLAVFGIPDNAKITSRLLPSEKDKPASDVWKVKEVSTQVLSHYLGTGHRPFICKVDTEGHEAHVVQGIGEHNLQRPHALVVEFWPHVLNNSVFGSSFGTFMLDNYTIININSSLYPRGFEEITDFRALSERLKQKEVNNIDLLLISNNVPAKADLILGILDSAEQSAGVLP